MIRRLVVVVVLLALAPPARATVQAVFDPAGTSFYDLPFPQELRRDPDGTISIARFFFPSNDLLDAYRTGIEESSGFGVAAGVFFKFDGDIDPATLPPDPEASRQPGASAFLIDVDPRSPARGTRVPLWIDFHTTGDAYRDPHLLTLMPAPGFVLRQGTLYAAVVTDDVHDGDGTPVATPPALQRLKDGTPQGAFETRALPLYQQLWSELEARESLARAHVVTATIYRTGTPAAGLQDVVRFVRRRYASAGTDLVYDAARSRPNYLVFRGHAVSPQFQNGTPPFTTTTGEFTFDARGHAIVQREETLEFVVAIPWGPTGRSNRKGWPMALCMHGTGGSRLSFLNDNTASRLADQGIASISFDQPLHGLRPGTSDDFYNPLKPLAFRDNTRQAAVDGLVMAEVAARVRLDLTALGVAPLPDAPTGTIIHADRHHLLFFGHSQGATVGPLVLALAHRFRGGVLSAGGGGLLLNIMTVDEPSLFNMTNRQLAELLLGTTLDVFHPVLHLLQTGAEPSDAFAYVDRLHLARHRHPLDLLFTHGMLDTQVTTPLTASMVVAAGYPLIAPTFPNRLFPGLPGYDYHDSFALAGLPTLTAPVAGHGGLVVFAGDDHFTVFHNPAAIAQWTGFMHSLATDKVATVPARP